MNPDQLAFGTLTAETVDLVNEFALIHLNRKKVDDYLLLESGVTDLHHFGLP